MQYLTIKGKTKIKEKDVRLITDKEYIDYLKLKKTRIEKIVEDKLIDITLHMKNTTENIFNELDFLCSARKTYNDLIEELNYIEGLPIPEDEVFVRMEDLSNHNLL